MKVILAGLPKTGTTSLIDALRLLGYNVHGFGENFIYHKEKWSKIVYEEEEDRNKLFKEIFKGVDASGDAPICNYWSELMQAFPDAKVILSVRNDEYQWLNSLKGQLTGAYTLQHMFVAPIVIRLPYISKGNSLMECWIKAVTGCNKYGNRFPHGNAVDDEKCKNVYLKHNEAVQSLTPKHKLLVYNVAEGWVPLCRFLEVPIPNEPFPHTNKDSAVTSDHSHPLVGKVLLLKYFFTSLIVLMLSAFMYLIYV